MMDSPTEMTSFGESLAVLYQSLAAADPLAAPPAALAGTANGVATTFASAAPDAQARYLLRALDEAIAALEVAARLADERHGTGSGTAVRAAAPPSETEPLYAAYVAFRDAQPAVFDTLYLYRNAVAAQVSEPPAQ